MIEIKLPKKPVDKYQIDWWRIFVSRYSYYIRQMHAVYYINTPYEELGLADRHGTALGAPLVDDWMIYENQSAVGRWIGWDYPAVSKYWNVSYLTREEAVEAVVEYLNNEIAHVKEEILCIEKMQREVRTWQKS